MTRKRHLRRNHLLKASGKIGGWGIEIIGSENQEEDL